MISMNRLRLHYGRIRGEEMHEMYRVAEACGLTLDDACFNAHWPALYAVAMTQRFGHGDWETLSAARLLRYARRLQRALWEASDRQFIVGVFWNVADRRLDAEAHWNMLDILQKIMPARLECLAASA